MVTSFIRNSECWKDGIVPDELMTERDALNEQERIAIREVLENE